jgi:hypothetical protein
LKITLTVLKKLERVNLLHEATFECHHCQAKLTSYLLTFRPVDDKSKFLAQAGYSQGNWEQAVGETIAVLVVAESQIEPFMNNEILHIRALDEAV